MDKNIHNQKRLIESELAAAETDLLNYTRQRVRSDGWLEEKHRTEEYKRLKHRFDKAFKRLQQFNKMYSSKVRFE